MSVNLRSVLISDPVDKLCENLLVEHGVSVTTKYKLPKDELIKELQKHDGLIVRSETKVTADVIAAAPNLRVIGRAGTGVDNIDVPAATRSGILVLNTPGGNSISACELTCAMILALARNVVQAGQSMREGRWDRKLYAGNELQGKTLGVLGFGRIGREVAQRMKAFGMSVVAFDPLLTDQQAIDLDVTKSTVEGVIHEADYITVHTPLLPHTRDLLNENNMMKCRKGFCVVNVARGGIISESGLLKVLEAGHCGGAALDVFTEEPPKDSEAIKKLIQHPKVIATPHLGASTAEAQVRVAVEIAEQFVAISGKSDRYAVTGIVNAPLMAAASNPANVAWIELARKLGILAGKLAGSGGRKITVDCSTCGEALNGRNFVGSALLLGLLAGRVDGQVNLVNALNYAEELGVQVNAIHRTGKENSVIVKIGTHEIKGTVNHNESFLLSIDHTNFDDGVRLQNNIALYRAKKPQDLVQIVSSHVAKSVTIYSLSVAGNWVVVQTDNAGTVDVDNVESY